MLQCPLETQSLSDIVVSLVLPSIDLLSAGMSAPQRLPTHSSSAPLQLLAEKGDPSSLLPHWHREAV